MCITWAHFHFYRIIFFHLSIILSTGGCLPLIGGGLFVTSDGQTPPRQTPPGQTPQDRPPRQSPSGRHPHNLGRHPHPSGTHHLPSACWDTVNKRAVRIPQECILVLSDVSWQINYIHSDSDNPVQFSFCCPQKFPNYIYSQTSSLFR